MLGNIDSVKDHVKHHVKHPVQFENYVQITKNTGFRQRAKSFFILFVLTLLGLLSLLCMAISPTSAMPLQHGMSLTPAKEATLSIEEYYVSEKLDGVRGYWDGKALYSRQGYEIVTPKWFIENLGDQPLDGELWLGRETFQKMSGLIARSDADDLLWQQVTFQIFDLPSEKGIFHERVKLMESYLSELSKENPHVVMIAQNKLSSHEELESLLKEIIAKGGEGLMLHHEDAHYQAYLRHDSLLKIKQIDQDCAVITGYTKGKGKYEGMVGALKVTSVIDGKMLEFAIGSGLTDQMRAFPPEIGDKITYLYNGFTQKGLPRFARLTSEDLLKCSD
ncbi:DNA ligase [Ignatzschineria sp. LJL83]